MMMSRANRDFDNFLALFNANVLNSQSIAIANISEKTTTSTFLQYFSQWESVQTSYSRVNIRSKTKLHPFVLISAI